MTHYYVIRLAVFFMFLLQSIIRLFNKYQYFLVPSLVESVTSQTAVNVFIVYVFVLFHADYAGNIGK